MDLFLKAAAAVLLAVILYLVVNSHSKELAVLLTVAVCLNQIIDFDGLRLMNKMNKFRLKSKAFTPCE